MVGRCSSTRTLQTEPLNLFSTCNVTRIERTKFSTTVDNDKLVLQQSTLAPATSWVLKCDHPVAPYDAPYNLTFYSSASLPPLCWRCTWLTVVHDRFACMDVLNQKPTLLYVSKVSPPCANGCEIHCIQLAEISDLLHNKVQGHTLLVDVACCLLLGGDLTPTHYRVWQWRIWVWSPPRRKDTLQGWAFLQQFLPQKVLMLSHWLTDCQ